MCGYAKRHLLVEKLKQEGPKIFLTGYESGDGEVHIDRFIAIRHRMPEIISVRARRGKTDFGISRYESLQSSLDISNAVIIFGRELGRLQSTSGIAGRVCDIADSDELISTHSRCQLGRISRCQTVAYSTILEPHGPRS